MTSGYPLLTTNDCGGQPWAINRGIVSKNNNEVKDAITSAS